MPLCSLLCVVYSRCSRKYENKENPEIQCMLIIILNCIIYYTYTFSNFYFTLNLFEEQKIEIKVLKHYTTYNCAAFGIHCLYLTYTLCLVCTLYGNNKERKSIWRESKRKSVGLISISLYILHFIQYTDTDVHTYGVRTDREEKVETLLQQRNKLPSPAHKDDFKKKNSQHSF